MNDKIELPGAGAGAAGRPGLWCIGSAVLDEATGCVTIAGQSHELDHSSHELLRHLLRNAGKMARKEDLLQIGWPGRLASENSLTKCIRRLRQALNDPEGKVLCTVHGYGYRLAARVEYVAQPDWEPVLGDHPPTAELPEAASPPAVSVLAHAPTYKRRRRLVALSAVMVALAMILLGTNWRAPETSAKADAPTIVAPPSIAVLPFKDLSPDKSQDYMADGITEELTNALAKIPRLRVIGQTTAFSFKGHEVDVMAIGKSLRLTHVLEGSVRISGDRIRVTAQLVRTSDAVQVWSQSYDRNLDDAFAVEDEIAVAVATRLKVQLLGGSTKKHRPDPRAYALVQRSRQIERLGFDEIDSIDRSGPVIRRAVAIDPEYSDAWYILGILYLDEVRAGRRPRAEGVQLARSAYGKSLALDPDNAVVYALMGNLSYFFERDPATATKYFERALSIEPDNIKVLYMGAFLADALGRQDEAIKAIEYSVDLDPVNAMTQTVLGNFYFGAHRWSDAIARYRTALALSPDIGFAHSAIGDALIQIGEPAAALASYKLENDARYRLYGLAVVNHSLGRKSESDAPLDTLIEKYGTEPDDGTSYWLIAAALAQRGETDRAFARLADMAIPSNYDFERAVELSSLHTDPRWLPFLRKHGKAPEQLAKLRGIKFDFKVPNN